MERHKSLLFNESYNKQAINLKKSTTDAEKLLLMSILQEILIQVNDKIKNIQHIPIDRYIFNIVITLVFIPEKCMVFAG